MLVAKQAAVCKHPRSESKARSRHEHEDVRVEVSELLEVAYESEPPVKDARSVGSPARLDVDRCAGPRRQCTAPLHDKRDEVVGEIVPHQLLNDGVLKFRSYLSLCSW